MQRGGSLGIYCEGLKGRKGEGTGIRINRRGQTGNDRTRHTQLLPGKHPSILSCLENPRKTTSARQSHREQLISWHLYCTNHHFPEPETETETRILNAYAHAQGKQTLPRHLPTLLLLRRCRQRPLLDQVLLAVERLGAQIRDDPELVLGQGAADIVVRSAPVVEGLLPTGR